MRDLTTTVSLPLDGEPTTFRIRKLDAFSGASLLKLVYKYLAPLADRQDLSDEDFLFEAFLALPDESLRWLMQTCLPRTEIQLPAGFLQVWGPDGWALPELEFSPACLLLTLEAARFTLRDFFTAGGPPSRPAVPASSP